MKFLRRKLANGITVIMEKRELPIVALSISNPFGGACESSEAKGVAHFIEHLAFTGTKNRTSEEISREVEQKGGVLNAFTADEATSFWFKLPNEHVFSGLDILIDILKNPIFPEKKFEKEKKVILEEIKMYNDDPRAAALKKVVGNLYEKPFGTGIIGTKESVSSLKRKFIAGLFGKVYNPENFVVTIVGNADFEKICSYLEENFGKKGKEKPKILKIKKKNAESVEEREGIDQAHFIFALHTPALGSSDFYAFEVLNSYLAGGASSRLFLEIREKRGLAYTIKSEVSAEKDYSYCVIYVGTMKENVDRVKKIILKEFENVKNMTEKELEKIKEKLIGLRKISAEESENVMNELMIYEMNGSAEEYYRYEDKIKSVKLEDVKRLAKIKNYSTAAIVPK